ncbi:MAG: glutamyl-tRNA amidotransferase [Bacteroidetes bacterium 4572_77]|nr:MAG: glutamyl-tRNA amidotransferase [Bacteroidetes bacterium 4572_77]
MSLEIIINDDIKSAMINKDREKLAALRAIKAALLLEKTGKDLSGGEIPESVEMALIQKQVKQRKEAAALYHEQNRADLAKDEEYQAAIIEAYLPKQMDQATLETEIKAIITQTGANSMKDMGKVMGMASAKFAGQADNKTISTIVRGLLG